MRWAAASRGPPGRASRWAVPPRPPRLFRPFTSARIPFVPSRGVRSRFWRPRDFSHQHTIFVSFCSTQTHTPVTFMQIYEVADTQRGLFEFHTSLHTCVSTDLTPQSLTSGERRSVGWLSTAKAARRAWRRSACSPPTGGTCRRECWRCRQRAWRRSALESPPPALAPSQWCRLWRRCGGAL